ncbi:hypothetical protein [Microbacterium sp. Marseille-Q6965]|uniref:hypothetical protein n=1 Tax=Microbacterium sp. Marseille-Q6965 TaxID=2965072 RepID=UPI0021B7299D|nr:hypothetical protein [Microbacterium sp. Marseille-Q6965]
MRILLKLVLDGDAHAAWRALHSPHALSELYGPLLSIEPLADLPTQWESGSDAPIRYAAGPLRLGTHLITITERATEDSRGTVRVLRDSGIPLTGPLAALDVWDHQMAVSPAPDDPSRTLWRERLVIGGTVAPLYWPALWALWQWRGARLKRLAPTWAYDPEPSDGD